MTPWPRFRKTGRVGSAAVRARYWSTIAGGRMHGPYPPPGLSCALSGSSIKDQPRIISMPGILAAFRVRPARTGMPDPGRGRAAARPARQHRHPRRGQSFQLRLRRSSPQTDKEVDADALVLGGIVRALEPHGDGKVAGIRGWSIGPLPVIEIGRSHV